MDLTSPTPASDPISNDAHLNNLSQNHIIFNIPASAISEPISNDNGLDNFSGHRIMYDTPAPGISHTHAIDDAESITPQFRARRDLVDGRTEDKIEICVPLYEAAITGNWEAAKEFFDKRPELVRYAITKFGDTPLHIAVSAGPTAAAEKFVENLVSRMETTDLEIENDSGECPFQNVVIKGSVKMIEVMIDKHKTLLNVYPLKTWSGLAVSTQYGNHEMAWHYYNIPEQKKLGWSWTQEQRCLFFIYCIEGDMLEIALKIISAGNLKISESIHTWTASLEILARKPDALNRTDTETGWIWRITHPFLAYLHWKKGIPDMDRNHALKLLKLILKSRPGYDIPDGIVSTYPVTFKENRPDDVKMRNHDELIVLAAEVGNTRFVIELLKMFPNLVWAINNDNQSIFHIAVMHRHISIYNLLYEIGSIKDILFGLCDGENNNILHLLGKTSDDTQYLTVSGASLLMQRELLWFKEVEKMIAPRMRIHKNKNGRTPYELFSEKNEALVSKGLKWTRDCMVVTALIITIAFAAALTVPGGFNQDSGIPILTREPSFIIFIIADAVSLFSSSTSLLVFLSITTSPYGQRDFLYSLPKKLMIGILTLFISVVAMMVTFAASFFVLYRNTYEWLPITISILAATPVVVYGSLQYPLLMDMFRSMYDSRYLFKPKRRVLYN